MICEMCGAEHESAGCCQCGYWHPWGTPCQSLAEDLTAGPPDPPTWDRIWPGNVPDPQ